VYTLFWVVAIVLCLATYQVACWLVALAHERSLVCWSVGLFGVSSVYMRPPSLASRVLEAAFPPMAVAGMSYLAFYVVRPTPLSAVNPGASDRLIAVLVAVALAVGLRGVHLYGDLRFPIWGEARLLALIDRSRTLGALVHFTPAGRRFLRERFDTTPGDFLREAR
jgi:hypothetical protein